MSYLESQAGRIQMPSARYILPEFEERTSYGFKRHNPYTKLFEDRIVFLGVQVDDASARRARRAGWPGHRQDGRRAAPRRVPALHAPLSA